MMRIILLGPPGAGKGTAAELLTKHFNIPHVSTGDIFRSLYKDKTAVGKIAKEFIDRGELVPDDITNEIVRHRLSHHDATKGFLFDGYPRNINQAANFDQFLNERNWKLDAVINIKLDDHIIADRISGRRVCETCGAVYHIINKKPKLDNICDKDGGKLYQREDDMEKTVLRRLRIYNEKTAPVIGYYEKKGAINHIDGRQSINEIFEAIKKVLGD